MNEFVYRFYCIIHFLAKYLLNHSSKFKKFRMVNGNDLFENLKMKKVVVEGSYFNEVNLQNETSFKKSDFFPEENIVSINSNLKLKDSFKSKSIRSFSKGVKTNDDAFKLWSLFIENSRIPIGFRNENYHFAGYIGDKINKWCLPSWIWTNAAIVRYYCNNNKLEEAKKLANKFIESQHSSGGWIVRFDYSVDGPIPVLAGNDSAYIANNCFLELFKLTNNQKYLLIAEKCADWIITTSRPDGLVWTGMDMKNNIWLKDYTIVDTAFTVGLFANLYKVTGKLNYLKFLESFCKRFIKLFYVENVGFATSINKDNVKTGGIFTRGQAWVLEGLIPAFEVTNSLYLKRVILDTINILIKSQLKNGGWPYNLSKPLMGEDCKGVPVLMKSLLNWYEIDGNEEIIDVIEKAINWCKFRTITEGEPIGGIFSFNSEGAIVHNHYTSTAFVYSSVYAYETLFKINLLKSERINNHR